MTIQGEIQSALDTGYTNKKTGVFNKQVTLLVMDRSKLFRCMTPFELRMTPEEFALNFPKRKPGDLTDEKCTLAITKMESFSPTAIRCPGALIRLGFVAPEAFAAEVTKAAA